MYNASQELIFQKAGFKRRESDLKTMLTKDEEDEDAEKDSKDQAVVKDSKDPTMAEKLDKCEKVLE